MRAAPRARPRRGRARRLARRGRDGRARPRWRAGALRRWPANQVPQLKALVERAGGAFLHHDGGIEHSMTLLPGLISRADCTMFPIDCISHDAMGMVKRQSRLTGTPFVPLRTSSLACLVGGLAGLTHAPEAAAAAE